MSDLILLTIRTLDVISCFSAIFIFFYSARDLAQRGGDFIDNLSLGVIFCCYPIMLIMYSMSDKKIDNELLLFIRLAWLALFTVVSIKEYKVIRAREKYTHFKKVFAHHKN